MSEYLLKKGLWPSEFRAFEIRKYRAINRSDVDNDRSIPAQNYLPDEYGYKAVVKLIIGDRPSLFEGDGSTFLAMNYKGIKRTYNLQEMESFCAIGLWPQSQMYGPYSLPDNLNLLYEFGERSRFVNDNHDIDEIFFKRRKRRAHNPVVPTGGDLLTKLRAL